MRGERITQSGISKGKDVAPGIYPKKKVENKAKVEEQVIEWVQIHSKEKQTLIK